MRAYKTGHTGQVRLELQQQSGLQITIFGKFHHQTIAKLGEQHIENLYRTLDIVQK